MKSETPITESEGKAQKLVPKACTNKKMPDRVANSPVRALLNSPNQFMYSGRKQDVMTIVLLYTEIGNIRLIINLYKDVSVVLTDNPFCYVVARAEHRALIY